MRTRIAGGLFPATLRVPGRVTTLNKTRASPSGTGPYKASKALTCTSIVTGSHGFVSESGEKAEIQHESVLVAVSAAGVI